MKKYLLCGLLFSAAAAQAQVKEGRVVYERTMQMSRMFNGIDPSVASQLPKSRTDQFELLFGNNQSLWQFLPSASTEDPGTFTGNGVVLRFGGGANEMSYFNLDKGTRTDQREIADRDYVVSDTITRLTWKFTEETKTILNYTARKATAQRNSMRPQTIMENGELKRQMVPDTASVVAWFTTDIPVPVGPEYQGQLPGLILEMDINKGQTVYKALEFAPKVNVSKIKEPNDGKKMTAAEFTKEREKVMEEMRRNMPNGGRIRINQ